MSEETKDVNKVKVTEEDFEKAQKNFNNEEYSKEEFLTLAKLYTDSFHDLKEGELIKGKIVRIQGDNVIIDVGFKSEGSIPKNEFYENEEIKVGKEVEVVLESVEDIEGNLDNITITDKFIDDLAKKLKNHFPYAHYTMTTEQVFKLFNNLRILYD